MLQHYLIIYISTVYVCGRSVFMFTIVKENHMKNNLFIVCRILCKAFMMFWCGGGKVIPVRLNLNTIIFDDDNNSNVEALLISIILCGARFTVFH